MTKKRRTLLFVLVPLVLATALVCLFLSSLHTDCPISRDGILALQPGMNEKEVNDLLGVPPGDYTSSQVIAFKPLAMIGARRGSFTPAKSARWADNKTGIQVDYDSEGRLVSAHAWSQTRSPFFDWLGAMWRSYWKKL